MIIYADEGESTLLKFRRRRMFRASDGGRGGPNKRRGRNGEHVRIGVPVGTEVWDAKGDELLADLVSHGESVVVAGAGRGGAGNARFVTSSNRGPLLAEAGQPGIARRLRLELKLLADIGLVGMPNAGKSSILAAISSARPKVAAYPFTTIEPVLGVVYRGMDAFVVVDIPGLVEGAHEGVGLGDEFLRHAERTRLLVHVVDGSEDGLSERVAAIDHELESYGQGLGGLPRVLAVNKIDLLEQDGGYGVVEKEAASMLGEGDTETCFVSAATHEGLDGLVNVMHRLLSQMKREPEPLSMQSNLPVLRPTGVNEVSRVVREAEDTYRIVHPRAVRLAEGSDLGDWTARAQYHAMLDRLGVSKALYDLGVGAGDTVLVGDWEFEWD